MSWRRLVSVVVFMVMCFFTTNSYALLTFDDGKLELEGTISHQSIVRNDTLHNSKTYYIQGMNIAELEGLYHLIEEPCQARGIVDKLDLRAIIRGMYDNVYDVTNEFGAGTGAFSEEEEDDFKSELRLREAYADVYKDKLWLRLGRQQIVWGKSDFFRLLDIINPLDYSWHFFFEDFDNIRIPQDMALAQYSIGDVGFLRSLSIQLVVNPGDVQHTRLGRAGEPWALAPPGYELIPQDFPNGPQYGGRIQAVAGPVSFTINDYYYYLQGGVFNLGTGELTYPRVNVVGGAIDYYNELTSAVWRAELTYTPDKEMGIDFTDSSFLSLLGKNSNGIVRKDEVKYVLGVDRPTWIRWLNQKSTYFLSAQLFMTHVLGHEQAITNDGAAVKKHEATITLLANSSYVNGKLTPQIYWAYGVSGDAHIVGPSVNYLITDNWAVKVGSNIIWGRDTRYANFGGFHDNDEVYAKISFTF